MGLTEKLIEISNEISEERDYIVEPRIIKMGDKKEYYGFEIKKISNVINLSPVFKLQRECEIITLTSFYRENDDLIKRIAERDKFTYHFDEISSRIFP